MSIMGLSFLLFDFLLTFTAVLFIGFYRFNPF
jgi:hypothetical protein